MVEYELAYNEFKEKYLIRWKQIIAREIRYKNPVKLNYEGLENLKTALSSKHDSDDKLFIFPCFIKPGKHYYTVRIDPQ